jgi:hypothetical protein
MIAHTHRQRPPLHVERQGRVEKTPLIPCTVIAAVPIILWAQEWRRIACLPVPFGMVITGKISPANRNLALRRGIGRS